MSGEAPLIQPIEGYTISVFRNDDDEGELIMETDLRLSRMGGAHIQGVADLIMIIEDAVFTAEKSRD